MNQQDPQAPEENIEPGAIGVPSEGSTPEAYRTGDVLSIHDINKINVARIDALVCQRNDAMDQNVVLRGQLTVQAKVIDELRQAVGMLKLALKDATPPQTLTDAEG